MHENREESESGVTYEVSDLKMNVGFPPSVLRHKWTVWNSQRASSASSLPC